MKHFANDAEAKEYGESLAKDEWETVEVGKDTVILCGTCIPYEDEFFCFAEKTLEKFGFDKDAAPEVRDAMITAFEEACDIRFLDASDTF